MNVATAPTSVLSKSQYAVLKNVSAGRVSQWISEGKISADALVGEGRGAKIDVGRADADLRRNLDIGQRFGNGLSTRLNTPAVLPLAQPAAPVTEPSSSPTPLQPGLDPIEEQIKRERLESLQRDNRKKAEDEAARAGRYVLSQGAAVQMGKIAATMLELFEGSLSDLASAMAA
jgi:hypothetical protein